MAKMEYSFRSAIEIDVSEVAALVNAAYKHYIARIGGPAHPMTDDYAEVIRNRRVTVAESQGTILGIIVLDVDAEGFLIDNVAVHPSYRGKGHTAFLNDAVFSPSGHLVATASADGTVRLWDTNTGQLLRTLVGNSDTVFSVAFTRDGKRLISGSRDRTARIWDVDYHDLVDAACNVLVRDFTHDERTHFEIQEPGPTCPSMSVKG